MSCPICGDRGIVRVRYRDKSPDAYGLCLCETGQRWRCAQNARKPVPPTWFIWAAQHNIPHDQVCPVEDLLDDDELATIPRASSPDHRSAIADTMRTKRPRL